MSSYIKMKDTNVNTSCEVTLFDNIVMATINKLKKQHKRPGLASIYKELAKNLEANNIIEDHSKNIINPLLVSEKITEKSKRDRPLDLLNENASPTATQPDPVVNHVYGPVLQGTLATPLNSPFSTSALHRQIETPAIGQQQTSPSILENELFLDIMLKKVPYTTFKKEIIIELQKTVDGILNLGLEQFKAKSEKALLYSHLLYQEQIKPLREACRMKDIMISKLLETVKT